MITHPDEVFATRQVSTRVLRRSRTVLSLLLLGFAGMTCAQSVSNDRWIGFDARFLEATNPQQLATLHTMLGRSDLIGAGAPRASNTCAVGDAKQASANEWIAANARETKLLMFNENHYGVEARAYVRSLLPKLKEIGFTHIGFEALLPASVQGGKPYSPADGYYTAEPMFAALLREATALGFTVFGYEAVDKEPLKDDASWQEKIRVREVGQARNVEEMMRSAPSSARFVLYAGWAHITESAARVAGAEESAAPLWMAARVKQSTGIDPLTIDLTGCTYQAAAEASATQGRIYLDADGTSRVVGNFSNLVDAQIHLPVAASQAPEAAGFHRRLLGLPFQVPPSLRPKDRPTLVRASRVGGTSDGVDFDRVYLRPGENLPLYLPPGSYRVTVHLGDGSTVGEPLDIELRPAAAAQNSGGPSRSNERWVNFDARFLEAKDAQQLATLHAMLGRSDLIGPDAPRASNTCDVGDAKQASANEWLAANARDTKLLMFNENHYGVEARAYVRSLLPKLKEMGFTHIGFEALQAPAVQGGQPYSPAGGYYTAEPMFAALLREAIALGFTVFGYEDTRGESPKDASIQEQIRVRETGQARNIEKMMQSAPSSARFVIYAGWGHIAEEPVSVGNDAQSEPARWMAARVKESAGIDPLTIDLTTCTYEAAADAPATEGRVYLDPDGAPRVLRMGNLVDAQFHLPVAAAKSPQAAGFHRRLLGAPVTLPAWSSRPKERPVLVRASKVGVASDGVDFDRVYLRPAENLPLYLPPGSYQVTMHLGDGSVVGSPLAINIQPAGAAQSSGKSK